MIQPVIFTGVSSKESFDVVTTLDLFLTYLAMKLYHKTAINVNELTYSQNRFVRLAKAEPCVII